MGGSPNLLMPVNPSYSASWVSHTRRSPKSSEPGTDMFVPIGTPVYAPSGGRIYGYGTTIGPATGRWVGIDFDNGLRFRAMHLSRLTRTSGRVSRGELIGYSGASGYGHEDWSHLSGMPGAHVHVTLWPSQVTRFGYGSNGLPYTVDFMQYVGGEQAAGVENGGGVVVPEKKRDELMSIPVLATSNGIDIWRILDSGKKRLVPPVEMDVYKSLAAKRGLNINDFIAEGVKLSAIPNA